MRVMILMKTTGNNADMPAPTAEAFAAMDRFTEELVAAGILVAAAGLKPITEGKRIAFDGADSRVIDSFPAGTQDVVAGFSIWEVRDMDEAVAWARRCPNPMPGKSEIEIRPFLEASDLAAFLTAEELATPHDGIRGKLGVA